MQVELDTFLKSAEIMQQSVMWLTSKGKILGVSKHFAEELGYSKDDFTPTTVFEVNPYLNFLSWKKSWEELTTKKLTSLESEYINSEGEMHPVNLRRIFYEFEEMPVCCTIIDNAQVVQPNINHSEEMYLSEYCLNNASAMIFWVKPDGSIFYVNKEVEKVLEYSEEEVKKMNAYELIKDFDKGKWIAHWNELKIRKQIKFESIQISKSRKEIPVLFSAKLLEHEGTLYNCIFATDISNLKKESEDLEFYKFCIERAGDMVFWIDKEGSVLYLNEEACKNLGYSRKEGGKLKILDFAPQRTEESRKEIFEEIKTKKFINFESLLKRKDKSIFPVEVSLNYLTVNDKGLICAFVRDITERKRERTKLEIAYEEIQRLKEMAEAENFILKEEKETEQNFTNIISKSESYKQVLRQVQQVADTEATVLVLGETGTGKELLARAIHQLSERADRPMIKVNCGALPATLIESELFGHEKGAFTGAYQQKKGRFEIANKSTIFLDEMGELPLDLQAKLLRVLQEGEFQRVGGNATIKVDVRIIAATNRNLEEQVEKGQFREDLYYRLNVFPIQNIPLRQRKDDIPPLVKHFVTKFSKKMNKRILEIPAGLMDKLMRYDFPGNVRELENMIERAMILSKGSKLSLDSLLFKTINVEKSGVFKSLEEIQRMHIIKALKQTNGRVSGEKGAAFLLKINDKTLVSRMKKLEIEKKDYL